MVVKLQLKIGALLSVENHAWFNQQSPEAQAEMNRKFQEYKACTVTYVENLDTGFSVKAGVFSVEPKKEKGKYDRTKAKKDFRKRVNDEWER